MTFGYSFLCGSHGADGYIRTTEGKRYVSVRGMKPGEPCVLYAFIDHGADICGQASADSDGHAALETTRSGPLFVVQRGMVCLWEGDDNNYLRACSFLSSPNTNPKESLQEEAIQNEKALTHEEALPKTDLANSVIAFREEKENVPQENISPAGKDEQNRAYPLRAPGNGEPVDALPERRYIRY